MPSGMVSRPFVSIGLGVLGWLVALQAGYLLMVWKLEASCVDAALRLAEARALADGTKIQYIETYRHLREHGNSFAIVVCEVFLAVVIYAGIGLAELVKSTAHGATQGFGFV